MKNYIIKLSRIFFFLISIFIFYLLVIFQNSIVAGKILSIFLIIVSILPILISIYYERVDLFLLFGFMSMYNFVPYNFYFLNKHANIRQICETPDIMYLTALLILFFYIILIPSINFKKQNNIKKPIVFHFPIAFYFLIITGFLCYIFGASGESILATGGYAFALETKASSSFFVYSIIPLALSFFYADTKFKLFCIYLACFFFCIKNLLFGGRVESIQLLSLIVLIRLQYVISFKKLLFIFAIGYIFFTIFGDFRSNTSVTIVDIIHNKFIDNEYDFLTNHSGNVYYASMRIMYLIKYNLISLYERFLSFIYFFISIFVPYSELPPLANLSTYMTKDFSSGGGVLAPIIMFSFASYLGILLFSLFISYVINKANKLSSIYTYLYSIFCIATVFRWYAYYPIQIIKFCFIAILLFWLTNKISNKKLL